MSPNHFAHNFFLNVLVKRALYICVLLVEKYNVEICDCEGVKTILSEKRFIDWSQVYLSYYAGPSADSSTGRPWQRKRARLAKVALMAAAKRRSSAIRREELDPDAPSSSHPAPESEPPVMDQDDLINENSDHDGSDSKDEFEDENF